MLHSPRFTVLAVDPGNNMGITIGSIDGATRKLHVLESITIVIDKALKARNDYQRNCRYTKHELIEEYLIDVLTELLEHYDVDAVIYEAAYHSVSMNAYESLLFYGRVIKSIALDYDWDIPIQAISPSTVKRLNGVNGKSSDKNLMTDAIRINKDIILPDDINIDDLSEHAVDSIGIAYSVLHSFTEAMPPLR